MAYFLEYTTPASAGHIMVEGVDFTSSLEKAKEALRGLDCTRAVLLFSPDPHRAIANGTVLAAYTLAQGWVTQAI
jgi:hypothetical protein